jgi:hypothetical protein
MREVKTYEVSYEVDGRVVSHIYPGTGRESTVAVLLDGQLFSNPYHPYDVVRAP